MHVLRKLTGCLSSTTCENDESSRYEENTSPSTPTLYPRLFFTADRAREKTIMNNNNNKAEPNFQSEAIERKIMICER